MATSFDKVIEYAAMEKLRKLPENIDGIGSVKEPNCGDVLTVAISTKREIITEIGYNITKEACPPVYACASCAAILAKGKAVMEAYLITAKDIEKLLSEDGELNKEHIHCAQMAELALKNAIVDHAKRIKENA